MSFLKATLRALTRCVTFFKISLFEIMCTGGFFTDPLLYFPSTECLLGNDTTVMSPTDCRLLLTILLQILKLERDNEKTILSEKNHVNSITFFILVYYLYILIFTNICSTKEYINCIGYNY